MKKLLALLFATVLTLTVVPTTNVSVSADTEYAVSQSVSQSNYASTNDAAKVLKQVPADLKGQTVKMLLWWTPDSKDKAKAEAFKSATGITVRCDTVPFNNYQNSLSSMIMAQNSPSLAAITNEWFPLTITRGLMQPIYNVEGWDWSDSSVYATNLMEQFSYKDVPYGIAVKGSVSNTFHVMFFNKNMLKSMGVKQNPYELWKAGKWNWDTCLEIAKKCTNAKNGYFGLTLLLQHYWMLSAGEDYVKTTKQGLMNNITSSGVLEAWNWSWDMIYTHRVVDTSYTGQTPFYQGTAAMLGAGSYMMQSNYVPGNMKDSWGVVPFPSPVGTTYAASEGVVWGFPTRVSGDKLQAAAWYIRYYLDDMNNMEIMGDIYDSKHPECWEIMDWAYDQEIQSYNSVGVLTYGGEYSAYSIQYSLIDEAENKGKVKSNLKSWASVLESKISHIQAETGSDLPDCSEGHHYTVATCTIPKMCKRCGKTLGEALGHTYKAATCTKAKTCKTCGATTGSKLGHKYSNGCDKSCNRCSYTRTATHNYTAATCTKAKTCKTCGATSGSKLGHKYTDALCDADCNVCGATRKAPHKYSDDCDIDCNLCGKVRKITHTYTNDCDEYCDICMEYREVKDHKYTNRCDRDCNECGFRRTVTHKYSNNCDNTCNLCGSKRKVATHVYKTAVGKPATLTANGYSIKTCTECKKTTGDKTVIRKVGHVKLSTITYTYDGKVKKPEVTIRDSYGNKISSSNYTVTYASGRKNVGTYKVTVKFKGKYSGTKTLTFKINPVKTTVSKLTAGKKSLKVAITKKSTQVTGYEVQYSTSKSFKSYKTKILTSYKKTSLTLSGLSAKKTYYVRVRTYKTVNGVKYYSGWSTVKHLKTK